MYRDGIRVKDANGNQFDVPLGVFTAALPIAKFNPATGLLEGAAAGGGTVTSVVSPSVAGRLVIWNDTSGQVLQTSTLAHTQLVINNAASVDRHLPVFSGVTGRLLIDDTGIVVAATSGNISGAGTYNGVDVAQFDSAVLPSRSQRILESGLPQSGTLLLTSGTAYFVYVGKTTKAITIIRVELNLTAAGVGTETREIGLFSTPAPPNRGNQSLTKLTAQATIDTVIAGTLPRVVRNTSVFSQVVPAGTHLWAGVRFAMGTTQPTFIAHGSDWSNGQILLTAASGVLTGAGPFAGVLATSTGVAAATGVAPAMRVTLD